MVPPPSTTTVEPVENGVDAKNKTAFATSDDCPMRRSGKRSTALANIASRSASAMPAHNGVSISPGETAFTLIGASSRATPRTSASSAALTAPCRTVFADGRKPAVGRGRPKDPCGDAFPHTWLVLTFAECRATKAQRLTSKRPGTRAMVTHSNEWHYTKALNPVIDLPTISVFISLVPS